MMALASLSDQLAYGPARTAGRGRAGQRHRPTRNLREVGHHATSLPMTIARVRRCCYTGPDCDAVARVRDGKLRLRHEGDLRKPVAACRGRVLLALTRRHSPSTASTRS
jgi:hypothetical protein